jgi:hypothetical protein
MGGGFGAGRAGGPTLTYATLPSWQDQLTSFGLRFAVLIIVVIADAARPPARVPRRWRLRLARIAGFRLAGIDNGCWW